MTKATHNGTCQVCGRHQAVSKTDGRLAAHGYTTRYGFFEGTCPGAYRLPLEVSRELCDQVTTDLRRQAEQLRTRAAALVAGTEKVERVSLMVRKDGRHQKLPLTRDEAEAIAGHLAFAWDRAANELPRELTYKAKLMDQAADDMQARAAKVHGQQLKPRQTESKPKAQRFESTDLKAIWAKRREAEDAGHRCVYRRSSWGPGGTLFIYPQD